MHLQRLHPDAALDAERALVARVTRHCARRAEADPPSLRLRIGVEGPDGRLDALIEAATMMEAVHLFEALRDAGYAPAAATPAEHERATRIGPVHRIYRREAGLMAG